MERFWSRVEKTDDCWLWMGYRDRRDYRPPFLRYGDPLPNLHGDHVRHPYKDFPLEVNSGYGPEFWTVEDMLAWVEREWDRQAGL